MLHFGEKMCKSILPIFEEPWWTRTSFVLEGRPLSLFITIHQMSPPTCSMVLSGLTL